ncbi:LAMI_0E01090g1_1 [Lachancea mirantina]|uniref:LAMI_0E01090g1_1 n=1 Tax=Lachancea mirantina TaxID=1230905 RepID=A0A1G4JJ74_9SACH|nr:LAMI_0E01090g1_1 [Lachancea mirantina]
MVKMDNSGLIRLVSTNLAFEQLWDNVRETQLTNLNCWILTGRPAHKLSNDDDDICDEWVLPVELLQYRCGRLTLEILDTVFHSVKSERITLAIVSDDGTIVYYFIYKGLHKPKKN